MNGPCGHRPACAPGAAPRPPSSRRLLVPLLAGIAKIACVGRTGGTAVDFPVMAAGPPTTTAGEPLACTSDGPWTIALSQASLHIGAVYLNQSQPVSGGQATDCYLPGTYVAQELSAIDVDLLSPVLAPFPALAHGITEPPALVGQVWLTHGDVNTIPDPEPVLRVAGTATRAGAAFPFTADLSIGSNRQGRNPGGSVAGGDPICKERIVTPIPAPITIAPSGALILRVDPCRLFTNVDFGQLPPGPTPGTYAFSDDPTAPTYTQPSANLYSNLRNTGPYAFSWAADL